jgi:hypothetical protein
MLERELSGLFPVSSFDDRRMRRELTLQKLAQVTALRDVVFGDEDGHIDRPGRF